MKKLVNWGGTVSNMSITVEVRGGNLEKAERVEKKVQKRYSQRVKKTILSKTI